MNKSHNTNVTLSQLLRLIYRLKSLGLLAFVAIALLITGCNNDSSGSSTAQNGQNEAETNSSDSAQLTSIDEVNTAIKNSVGVLPDVLGDLQESAPIVFEPGIIDLGKMFPRDLITSKFTLRNLGNTPMTIKAIKPACGCTKLDDYYGLVIPPGESVELEARTKSRTVPSSFSSSISFLFEEYIAPSTISMFGEVTRVIRTAPKYFNCVANRDSGLRKDSGLIVVESLDGKPFTILSANGVEPIYESFDPDFDEPQSSYKLVWDISQYENVNPPKYWIIETDNPNCPVVDVWVRHEANVPVTAGLWRVRTQHVVVGGIKPGESAEFEVDIHNRTGVPCTTHLVRSLSKNFKAKVVSFSPIGKIPPDSTIKVRITPTPGYEGLLNGRIQFMLNGQPQNVIILGKVFEKTDEGEQ